MKKAIFSVALLAILFPVVALGESREANSRVKIDAPQIDEEAASVAKDKKGNVVEEKGVGAKTKEVNKYPENFWIFLLEAYVFILIFNLTLGFKKAKAPQWFWEAVYTFLAIFTWDQLDSWRVNSWFPKAIVGMVVILYIFYFYFLKKKKSLELEGNLEKEEDAYPRQDKLL